MSANERREGPVMVATRCIYMSLSLSLCVCVCVCECVFRVELFSGTPFLTIRTVPPRNTAREEALTSMPPSTGASIL